jgi:NADPH-dependent 2,4-dienoyl-CoA reductase/sulfur reductase-like enzyme
VTDLIPRPVGPDAVEVAIIGAGPYGLSLATQLRSRGVRFRIFGSPMSSWKRMAQGMSLKSPDFGTSIYSPVDGSTFLDYCGQRGISTTEPCEIAKFADYGIWAQQNLVPDLEVTEVTAVERQGDGFRITLATGEVAAARNVVAAVGLTHFARLPLELAGISSELVSHTSWRSEYSSFGGKRVLVLGAGQSALEAAALLHEAGAEVELLVRGDGAHFAAPPPARRILRHRVLYPMSVMGPGRLNFFLQRVPLAMHYYPEAQRVALVKRHLGPWGAWWLRQRVEGKVPVRPNARVLDARPSGSRLEVRIQQQGTGELRLAVDHLVCGTGFEVDVDRLLFLDDKVRSAIRRVEKAPALSRHFESSVKGLYFIGPASAFSFGPLLRFVAGAAYAAPALARHIARNATRIADRRMPRAHPATQE